jgi:anti-sigma B factor antagonist
MDFAIAHHLEGEIAVVEVSGWIEISSAPRLRDTLIGLIDEGHLHLVLDMSAVVFLDSTGLGVLVGALKRLRATGGTFGLVCAKEPLLKIFRITALDQVFPIYPSVETATSTIPDERDGSGPAA